jgi:hypothetical protein
MSSRNTSFKMSIIFAPVVALLLTGAYAQSVAADVGQDRLEAIAEDVMTPVPKTLRTMGTVTRELKTNTQPTRGLDMCMDRQRVGIYAPTPQATTTWALDYKYKPENVSVTQLTEITLDISEYGSAKKASAAWQDVVRTLESTCAGYVQVPGLPETLADGSNVTWSTNEFNEVTVTDAARNQGPVGLESMFTIILFDPNDARSTSVVTSELVMQYSSWRLAGSTIVRAEYAREWSPMSAAEPSDPTNPFLTSEVKSSVDRLAKKASREIIAQG